MVEAWVARNRRLVVWSWRAGAGGMPSRLRIRLIVDGLTRWPRPRSALDALVAPAEIVAGHPLDEGDDGHVGRRAAGPVREGPVAGDQAAMPGKNSARIDEPVHLQPAG
jgi:hypothetical protein